jgi:hypothetical protein
MTLTDKLTPSAIKDAMLEYKHRKHSASPAVALNIRVGARKGKETSDGSTNSRNSESQRKCTHFRKRNHKEYECCKEKAYETATAEKGQDSTKYTADATAKVAHAETMLESAPSSHNEERIRSFIARQPAARRMPAHHWLINSRASAPMTAHHNLLIAYRTLQSPKRIWLGDERHVNAIGIGQIALDIPSSKSTSRFVVRDVLHVPELHGFLLSVSKLVRRGFILAFDSDGCKIWSTASGAPIARAHVEDTLYILNTTSFIHHTCIRADYSYLDELDEERHQLNPETIECAPFGPVSSRSAYMCADNPIDCTHKSRNTTFGEDLTSMLERIRLKTDPYVLHVPDLHGSLISVSSLIQQGHTISFDRAGWSARRLHGCVKKLIDSFAPAAWLETRRCQVAKCTVRTQPCQQATPSLNHKEIRRHRHSDCPSRLRLHNITFNKDSASMSARICFKSDPCILQRSNTLSPLYTASIEAFHMLKEPPKAAVKDTPSEGIYLSDSVRRSTRTGESTHTSLSQAAPSFTSSLSSMQPRNALICDDNPRLETISHSCRSELHPHAPPSNSVGNIYAYKHANVASFDWDLL